MSLKFINDNVCVKNNGIRFRKRPNFVSLNLLQIGLFCHQNQTLNYDYKYRTGI